MKTEDLNKAVAGFLIAMGQTLPLELAQRIRLHAHQLADQMAQNGEASVAKLTKGFGDAITAAHEPPDSSR